MDLNPVILAIPVFFLLIFVELIYGRIHERRMYRLNDAFSNISCGITEKVTGVFASVFTILAYEWTHANFRLFDLANTWYWFIIAFVMQDFLYYWAHRLSHEVNLFWTGHVVHHQSEDYNLSVALRQGALQKVWTFYFYLPMAFLGISTEFFVLTGSINLLYQFWIHTEAIDRLPRWFEYVFNTPSHHRVHHARNPKYIDRNHGGTLILFDRLFGTFQEEDERPVYGVTTPLTTFNPIRAHWQPVAQLARELQMVSGWKNKLLLLFNKPGWLPAEMGGYRAPKEVDTASYQKFEVAIPMGMNYYLLAQYVLILGGVAAWLFTAGNYSTLFNAGLASLILLSVFSLGALFDARPWSFYLEYVRLAATAGGLVWIALGTAWFPLVGGVAALWMVASALLLRRFEGAAQTFSR